MKRFAFVFFCLCLILSGCHRSSGEDQGRFGRLQPGIPLNLKHAGRISGVIRLAGAPPVLPELNMQGDPYCASQQAEPVADPSIIVNSNHTLRSAFVYIAHGLGRYQFRPPRQAVNLIQRRCMYRPVVLGIMVGQPLRISSDDATTHNIHAMGRGSEQWNLSMPPGAPPQTRIFNRPKIMLPIDCNVHPWMKAWIGVMPSPYYFVTGKSGKFHFPPLPPGAYTVAVWQAYWGIQRRQVNLQPGQHLQLDFTYSADGRAAL